MQNKIHYATNTDWVWYDHSVCTQSGAGDPPIIGDSVANESSFNGR